MDDTETASNSELFGALQSFADDMNVLKELTIDQAFIGCKITMDMKKFWLDMEECLNCISQVTTKLSLACMDPPLPTSKELWPLLKNLKLSLTTLSFYCSTCCYYLYGMTLKVNLTQTTENVFEGVIKLLHHLVETNPEKRKRYLHSTGYIWDVAEKFPKLPKDNEEAVLMKIKENLNMISDACDELTESLQNNSSSVKNDDDDDDDESPMIWSANELPLAQSVSGLVKATKFCLVKLISAIEKNAKSDYYNPNGNPSQENPSVEIPTPEKNKSLFSRFIKNKGLLDLNSLQLDADDTISSEHSDQNKSNEVMENDAEPGDQNESSENSNEQIILRTKIDLSKLIEAVENDLKTDDQSESFGNSTTENPTMENPAMEIPTMEIPSVGVIQNETLLNELLQTKVGQLDLISIQSERISPLTDSLVTMLYPPIIDVDGIISNINELKANIDWIISLAKKSYYIPKDEENSLLDFAEKAVSHNVCKSLKSVETFVASRNNSQ